MGTGTARRGGVLFILAREQRRNKSWSSAGHWAGWARRRKKIIVQNFIGELEKRRFCEQIVASRSRTSPSPISKFRSHQHPLSCCKTWGKWEKTQLHTFQCKSLILARKRAGESTALGVVYKKTSPQNESVEIFRDPRQAWLPRSLLLLPERGHEVAAGVQPRP